MCGPIHGVSIERSHKRRGSLYVCPTSRVRRTAEMILTCSTLKGSVNLSDIEFDGKGHNTCVNGYYLKPPARDNLMAISSTKSMRLELPPSCLQFCPVDRSCFVVGTYNLESQDPTEQQQDLPEESTFKRPQSRNGSLILFHLDGSDLIKIQTEPQPSAVLDLRFHPTRRTPQSVFAVVSSTGTLAIYRLETGDGPALEHVATSRCADLGEDVLFLQCNWHPSVENTIAVTTSTGLARLLHLDNSWSIQGWTDLDIQNTLEAWSVCLSNPDNSRGEIGQPTTVYCGGDDSILRYTSCSLVPHDNDAKMETISASIGIKGAHNAGVTAILPLSTWTSAGWRVVVTGSYDDMLRVFAIHDPHESHGTKMVQLLTEIDLGGGVWRLDLIDLKSDSCGKGSVHILLLASCMHAGARIVEIVTDDGQCWRSAVLAKFEEHQSMNYASDCVYNPDERSLTCLSTSFYDRLLCLWTYSL